LHLGFAFAGGSPKAGDAKPFFPGHIEVRAAYWFGKKPFAKKGIHPFVLAMAGAAEVDAKVSTRITEHTLAEDSLADPDGNQTVDVYRKAGTGFAGIGAGVMYALSPKGGIVFDLKLMQMFPVSATVIAPEIGYSFGF
jgi:hypothetical protein